MTKERATDLIDGQIRDIELQKLEAKKDIETLMMRMRVAKSTIQTLAVNDPRRVGLVENAAELVRAYRDASNSLALDSNQIRKLRDTKTNLQKTANVSKTIAVLDATAPLLEGQTLQLEQARAAILASNAINSKVANGITSLNNVFAEGAGSMDLAGQNLALEHSKLDAESVLRDISEVLSPNVRTDFMTADDGDLQLPDVPNNFESSPKEPKTEGVMAVAVATVDGRQSVHNIPFGTASRRPRPLKSVDDDNDEGEK
jgi:hypothetical protein